MGQTASQIENHIEDKRQDLSSNLHELEDKVKSMTDWRRQFQNRPLAFLGLAFGGGLMLAALANGSPGRRRRRYNYRPYDYSPPITSGTESRHRGSAPGAPSPMMDKAYRAWENIKGALIGIAATRVKDYAEEILPGFSEQYQKTEAGQNR